MRFNAIACIEKTLSIHANTDICKLCIEALKAVTIIHMHP